MATDTATVRTSTIDWAAEVAKAWGTEYKQPEVVYEFSDGREFQSTDNANSGIYVP